MGRYGSEMQFDAIMSVKWFALDGRRTCSLDEEFVMFDGMQTS